MDVKWAIEKEVWHPKEDEAIIEACDALGIKYKWVTYQGMRSDAYRYFVPNECVVLYGSLKMVHLMREIDWVPGIFCTMSRYDCHKYYPILRDSLLNGNYYLLPFGDLSRLKEEIYRAFWHFAPYHEACAQPTVFMRPDSGNKVFTGDIVKYDEFDEKLKYFQIAGEIDPSQLVLISNFQRIMREWRFFVVNGEVITGCLYKSTSLSDCDRNSHESLFNEAMRVARLAAQKYQPDPCFTVDVCQTERDVNRSISDCKLKILELNAFSTSSMYECNIKVIIEAVSKIAWHQHQDYFYGSKEDGRISSAVDV